jgi:NADH-quinone oxidoreductase subunit J
MTIETLLVALVAVIAAVAGVMVVLMRTAVYSALCLILNFFCLAFLYITLNAEFIGVVNIIVYAGAIMVLFLFVIFLINPTREEERDRLGGQRRLALGLGLALLVLLGAIMSRADPALLAQLPPAPPAASDPTITNVHQVGELLFTRFLFPFEVTSLILLAAVIGAIVLAKRTL